MYPISFLLDQWHLLEVLLQEDKPNTSSTVTSVELAAAYHEGAAFEQHCCVAPGQALKPRGSVRVEI